MSKLAVRQGNGKSPHSRAAGRADGQSRPLGQLRGLPSGRAVVGGLLIALAAVGTFAAYTGATAQHRVDYVVAHKALSVGQRISAADLALAPMGLPPSVADRWAFRHESSLVGSRVVGPLAAGELIQASDVVAGANTSAQEQMSFAIAGSDAVGGSLQPGDRVDVLATFGTGTLAQTVTVLSDAPVLSQVGASPGAGINGSPEETITLGLSSAVQALALAHAVSTAQVMLVRVTAAAAGAGTGSGLGL